MTTVATEPNDFLIEHTGKYPLTGYRSARIARGMAWLLPIPLLAAWAAVISEDYLALSSFIGLGVAMLGIIRILSTARLKFEAATLSRSGITFAPSALTVPTSDISEMELGETTTGRKLFFVRLKSPLFVPYFGTVWCLGKTLVINTE